MKCFFFCSIFLFTTLGFSQDFEISGKILDEKGSPLESATVYLEKPVDSSLVTYTISGKGGSFRLTGDADAKKLNLVISFAGYQPYVKQLEVQERLQLDPIHLKVQDNELKEVVITTTRAPITIKKDTLEFNADSFTTKPNANLEELMKKLPGVEVDSDGNITINGKPVSRILVNGEEFFGNDPKIATKNLPKEIIDKIQVTDTKTKAEEFTGKPGDPNNKTINITIKEDRNKGYFARATAGGGTDQRYELSAIANYFQDDLRISALGSSNNINSSGFSYDEVFGMMGRNAGRAVFGGSGAGITKSETAGLNVVNKWEDELSLNADYFFGRNDTERRTEVARENILPDSKYFTHSETRSNLFNDTHRANLRFEVEFDSLTRLSIRPRINSNFGESHQSRSSASLNEDRKLINSSETFNDEAFESTDLSNDIDFIRRFGRRGAFLQLEFSNTHHEQNNDDFFYSESIFMEDGAETFLVQDQYIDEDEKENAYSFEASQRNVLSENFYLDIAYDFEYASSSNKRYVYESEDATGNYSTLNTALSNDFEVKNRRHIPNVGLNYEGDVWRISSEIGLLHTSLDNHDNLRNISFDNTYNNLYIESEIRYQIERSKSLSLGYETDVDIPSIRQLQPVEDRTNPLNIVIGNPALTPTYSQRFNLSYRNFDFETRSGIFSWANLGFTEDNVVAVTSINEALIRTTTFRNVDGGLNASLGAFFSKQIKNDAREFRYRLGIRASYNKGVGFTNMVRYEAQRFELNPSVRFSYAITELLELSPNYRLSYHETTYDIDADRNENFMSHRLGLEAISYWPENVVFGNDVSFNHFGDVAPGFENSSWFWNMSLGYQFLDEKATLKLKVYDLLDQNVNTRRTIGDDYIQDTSNLILTRYAMLSFTMKFEEFGGRKPRENRGYRR